MGVVFFFQAEEGMRDDDVTGVQTCALPIFTASALNAGAALPMKLLMGRGSRGSVGRGKRWKTAPGAARGGSITGCDPAVNGRVTHVEARTRPCASSDTPTPNPGAQDRKEPRPGIGLALCLEEP